MKHKTDVEKVKDQIDEVVDKFNHGVPSTDFLEEELAPRPTYNTVDRGPVLTIHDVPGLYGNTHKFNCLSKLQPGEPFFVFRAQDLSADFFVEMWAAAAEKRGCNPAKVREARQVAADMRGHAGRKYPD